MSEEDKFYPVCLLCNGPMFKDDDERLYYDPKTGCSFHMGCYLARQLEDDLT
jgi:hypothetical protein